MVSKIIKFCSRSNASSICNGTRGMDEKLRSLQSISACFVKSRTIGHSITSVGSILGLLVNLYLLMVLLRLWKEKKIKWRHFPLTLAMVCVDVGGCCLLACDAFVYLFFGKFAFGAGRYSALSIAAFTMSFIIPALGCALQGILQVVAVTKPLAYSIEFTTPRARKLGIGYVFLSAAILALFTGLAVNARTVNSRMTQSMYWLMMSVNITYGILMVVFVVCNLKITQMILMSGWKGVRKHSNEKQNAKSVRIHIIIHTVIGLCFWITHLAIIVCRYKIADILDHNLPTCDTCYKILEIKQDAKLNQLFIWLFRVIWTTRYFIEPYVMLRHADVRKAVENHVSTVRRSLSKSDN